MILNNFQISLTHILHAIRLLICILLIATSHKAFANDHDFLATKLLNIPDTFPKTLDSTAIIPFEYKQSTLNYASTFRVMDSVADILNKDTSIGFSILGYSHFDEGNDYVCYWLSHDRAYAVKTYLFGRGVDSMRMRTMNAESKFRSLKPGYQKAPVSYNHTTEIILHYPIPPPPVNIDDMDGDGIADEIDSCANEFGYAEMNGCPDRDAIIVPFEGGRSAIIGAAYKVMDSIINIMRKDLSLSIRIDGHAYRSEGVQSLCDRLAIERADIVRRYLLTRRIDSSRIISVNSMSSSRPLNAGRNPREIAKNCRAELHLVKKD